MDSLRKAPQVSIILPVYNGTEFLDAAIESILNQSFTDFELIIIDDGSSDNSFEVIRSFHDHRVRLYQQQNVGLAATLNRGIGLAQGKYIARQDQDDISFPDRLMKQVAFLESHEHCALVGTWAEIWTGDTKTERLHANPADDSILKFELLFNNPFVHSSVMLRKEALTFVGGYTTDPERQPPEDYDLWSRIAQHYDVANIADVLHIYREVPTSMSRTGESPFLLRVLTISAENIAWAAEISPHEVHVQNLPALIHGAWEHVIAPPKYFAMQTILNRAVIHVVSSEKRRELLEIARNRLMSAVIGYWMQQGFSLRGGLLRLWRYSNLVTKMVMKKLSQSIGD